MDVFGSCVLEGEVVEKMGSPEFRLVEDVGSIQNQFEEEGSLGETDVSFGKVVADGAHPAGERVRECVIEMIDHPQQINHAGMTIYDVLFDLSIYIDVIGIIFQGDWFPFILIFILFLYLCHFGQGDHLLFNNVKGTFEILFFYFSSYFFDFVSEGNVGFHNFELCFNLESEIDFVGVDEVIPEGTFFIKEKAFEMFFVGLGWDKEDDKAVIGVASILAVGTEGVFSFILVVFLKILH